MPPHPLADAPDLCRLGVAALTEGYRTGTFSPVEVARACLDRAAVVHGRFNAFCLIDEDVALAAARASEARWRAGAPLSAIDGVPTTIKDIVWVKGWNVRYGTRTSPGITAGEDAPAVHLLREAGAVLLGLTTTPEFGWKAVTDSALTGITRNPWNPDHTPGGSSGGAAVAAVTGAGVLHLGTDGGGSIRIPSGFTGIVGHKPTFSRVPAYPASPFGTVAHLGPMARTVADAAAMLDVMSGRDLRDWYQNPLTFAPVTPVMPRLLAGLRVGVWQTPPRGAVQPEVAAVFEVALRTLENAGAELAPVTLPGEELWELFSAHWYPGAAARLAALAPETLPLVEAGLREIAAAGARYTAVEIIGAAGRRATFGAAFEQLFAAHDIIASPAVAVTAIEAGKEVPDGSGLGRWTEWAGFSYPINLTQSPACVVPAGLGDNGLPVGLQLIGRRGDDAGVLAVAAAFEALAAPLTP